MSDNVVDLNARRPSPYLQGEAKCGQCSHQWRAVAPCGTVELECPKCGAYKGFFMTYMSSEDGVGRYTCNACQGQMYEIRDDGALCVTCGFIHNWAGVFGEE